MNEWNPFELDKIGRVNKFSSITLRKYPNVKWEVKNFGKSTAEYKRHVYRSYKIHTYDMDPEEIERFNAAIAQQELIDEQLQQKLIDLKKPLKGAHNFIDFEPSLAVGVLQGEYAITTSESEQPVLGTYGAGPCLIVAIYDSNSRTAFLTHIDTLSDLQSLKYIIKSFDSQHSTVHLFGGDNSSAEMVMDVVEILESMNFQLHNTDIVRDSFESASMAIDARTGKIFTQVRPDHLTTKQDMLRLQMRGMQFSKSALIKVYDGRM